MRKFIQRHSASVIGVLSGFDRVRVRGTLRWLSNTRGMLGFLSKTNLLLKDFIAHAQQVTERIRERAADDARAAGRELRYLASSQDRKEDIARQIAARDGVREGLICVLTSVEPCRTYQVRRNRERRRLELQLGPGKCLHQYHYFQDEELGLLHVRLQTWYPFTLHVCFNGRSWLARQMDAAGLRYVQRDNCFVEVEDVAAAQQLLERQLRRSWGSLLSRLQRQAHPLHNTLWGDVRCPYYWSVDESEWATDVLFRSEEELAALYPRLVRHGLHALSSPDVMRFLGHRTPAHGGVNGRFQGQVVTDLKHRPEGVRIKHRVGRNSLKMYDKQGTVLRVETTLNEAGALKVYRASEAAAQRERETGQPAAKRWRPLRKGVADLARRAQLSQAANNRYLDALAQVDDAAPLEKLMAGLCQPTVLGNRRVRALRPLGDDQPLLEAVNRGEFALHGFRNRDLRALLYAEAPADAAAHRKQAAAISRRLRLLRAHGLIAKIPKTHRYQLTALGRAAITAILTAQQASTAKLNELAA